MNNFLEYYDLLISDQSYSAISVYKKNIKCHLSSLCETHGSDKGYINLIDKPYPWKPHTYCDYYSKLFQHCKNHIKNVFECGIGTNNISIPSIMSINGRPGASLRVWRDYFPYANIIGADVDKAICFNEERIQCFFVDQTSKQSISELWNTVPINSFDLMIDDGLHTFLAGITLFENSIHKLSKDGVYIIEDVNLSNILNFQKYFTDKIFDVEYLILTSPDMKIISDNNLVVIRNIN